VYQIRVILSNSILQMDCHPCQTPVCAKLNRFKLNRFVNCGIMAQLNEVTAKRPDQIPKNLEFGVE
jgi:hypothetical protein